eukprot:scaffold80720_cov71-Phaeocystis_antarctica.AAC.7
MRNPPCRTRSATAFGASDSGSSAHRDAGTSLTVSTPPAAMRHAASKDCTPPGSWALEPTSAADKVSDQASLGARSVAGCAAAPCASSVEGSARLGPTACCNWLRSSTAPSESRPASISGASASMALPAVRCTRDITVSKPTRGLARSASSGDAAAGGASLGANAERKAGTSPLLRTRGHTAGTIPTTAAASEVTEASAAKPCASPISPKPSALSRAFTPPPAAIPTSAHGPHWTLVAASPAPRRPHASASRQLLAAA